VEGSAVLRVFVVLNGTHQPLEVTVPPSGQNLVAAAPQPGAGRKAHFWWTLEELEQKNPEAASALRMLAPNLDRLWVGRDLAPGQQLQSVFDGTVVECGHDPAMVSVTAMEPPPPRPAAAPPQAPGGGVREPVRPMPTGPGPESMAPPQETGGGTGNLLTQGMFVRGRESVGAAQTG
jgi:hypothetical protein